MAGKGIAEGPAGESVFHTPLMPSIERLIEIPNLLSKARGLHDHRLIALVSALIVEERMDKLLSAFMPRYNVFEDISDFGFSMKIRTLEALNLIPKHITEACHIVRLTRNDFAHNLERTKFSHCDKKILNKTAELLRRVMPQLYIPAGDDEAMQKNFDHVALIAIACTEVYVQNLETLRSKLADQSFIKAMHTEAKQKFESTYANPKHQKPEN